MREDWIEAIKTIVDESRIRLQEPMSRHTTFRIGGMAVIFLMPTIKEAVDVITLCRAKKIPYTIIGNGSNLLVSDRGFRGVLDLQSILLKREDMIRRRSCLICFLMGKGRRRSVMIIGRRWHSVSKKVI